MDVRVAAYGVIVAEGRVLLAHWNEHGRSGWTLPGGGVEDFESPGDAAVREIREETGFDARLEELLAVDSSYVDGAQRADGSGRPLHVLRVVYTATITGGDLTHERDGSTDEARWFDLDRVEDLERVGLVDVAMVHWRARAAGGGHRPGRSTTAAAVPPHDPSAGTSNISAAT